MILVILKIREGRLENDTERTGETKNWNWEEITERG